MHALFIKTEWRSRSSPMDTSRGVLLRALDKWYLLVQANSCRDPHLSLWVISDSSGNISSQRACASPDRHHCLHRRGQPIHYLSPLTGDDRTRQQKKVDTDDKDKPRCKATGRCNPQLRCEDGWHAGGLNVRFRRKKTIGCYILFYLIYISFGFWMLLGTIWLICHHWCTWQEISAVKQKCENQKELGNRKCEAAMELQPIVWLAWSCHISCQRCAKL